MRYSTTTTVSSSLLLLASTALAANSTLAGLNDLAKAAGKKYFGTSTDNNEITDQTYLSALQNPSMWGALTPGNSQKWQFTEKQPGQFSFDDGDAIVKIAQDNGMLVRCHTLVWYSQLPSWVTSGTWTNETLSAVMKTHIENEVSHFKGKCYAWDVVNEALEEDGTFRKNVFLENIGESYIPTAFGIAAAADPDAKLYYNDYNIETTGKKQAAAVNIVKAVKAAGQKIDGVGLQAHLTVGQVAPQSSYASVLKSFVDAGVTEVAYTELDIRFSSLPSTDSGLKTQGDNYAAVVGACLDTKECVGVTIWDFSDKYSWVPSTFPGNGDALIFDKNFEPKPAYFSISSVLAVAATGTPASTGTATTVKASAIATASASVSASATSTAAASSKFAASKTTLATVVKATGSASTTTSAPASSTTDDEFCDVEDDGDNELVATSSASSAASTATGTVGAKAAQYQQCGGNGFTGPTECVDGFTCKVQNPYYSQCL